MIVAPGALGSHQDPPGESAQAGGGGNSHGAVPAEPVDTCQGHVPGDLVDKEGEVAGAGDGGGS